MIVLDSDHLTVLRYPESARHAALMARMRASEDRTFVTSIINVEEQLRGWLAFISRIRDPRGQIVAYDRLGQLFDFYAAWRVLSWTEPAVRRFETLQRGRPRIGTQDLKIASIVLENDALLLTANMKDFRRVPGLRMENWLT
jgi:tRNA(fMet)-specific endonuclease VapC